VTFRSFTGRRCEFWPVVLSGKPVENENNMTKCGCPSVKEIYEDRESSIYQDIERFTRLGAYELKNDHEGITEDVSHPL
jgi:hypothetical protein